MQLIITMLVSRSTTSVYVPIKKNYFLLISIYPTLSYSKNVKLRERYKDSQRKMLASLLGSVSNQEKDLCITGAKAKFGMHLSVCL